MKQIEAKIQKNEEVAPGFYRVRVKSPYLAEHSKPGQFIEVKCSDGTEPLLRRPLGVHRITDSGIEMLYEVVGKGTELLSRKVSGEALDVIGPLGNGFTLSTKHYPLNTILIAGGIGVAPLLSLAEYLAYRGKRKLYVLIGACKKEHILCEREFNKLGAEVLISTEDGSKGHKGLVTDLLRKIVIASPGGAKQSRFKLLRRRFTPPRNDIVTTIYTCGPVGMLKTVAEIARRNRIPCQVSLEERMACGVGVCLGCPVKVVPSPARGGKHGKRPVPPRAGKATNHEYKMVCKDGPVFNAEEIVW